MQQVYQPPAMGKIALQYGLIFGLIVAFIKTDVLVMNTFMNNTPSSAATAFILGSIDFLLGLAAFFVVGIFASKQTAKVSTGTIAGLWAGLVYGVIGFTVSLLLFFMISLPRALDAANASSAASSTSAEDLKTWAITSIISGAIFGLLFTISLGAGLGALGGLIGKSTSKMATQSPVPAYPYQPYPYQGFSQLGFVTPVVPVLFASFERETRLESDFLGEAPYQPYPGQPYPNHEPIPLYYEQLR